MSSARSASLGAPFDLRGKRVWVAGHSGMVGSAIARRLAREGCEVLTATRATVDLRRQAETEEWVEKQRPDAVFLAAATVGGIQANAAHPAEFLYDNLAIATNVVHAAYRAGVGKLMVLGSSCIYPKVTPQPIPEAALLTGALEATNAAYAVAKIAAIRLAQSYRREHGCDFIAAMPTSLYGGGDNFDPGSSHVIPGMMVRFDEARRQGRSVVSIWGSGAPRREFLFVDDLADALVFLMQRYSDEDHVNVGWGEDVSIRELAQTIARVTGFQGELEFDRSKPDGTPRKLLDTSRMQALGWRPTTGLENGLRITYRHYLATAELPAKRAGANAA